MRCKVLVLCCSFALAASALSDDKDKEKGKGNETAKSASKPAPAAKSDPTPKVQNLDPTTWNIESMIGQAGENVAKRYNCNEEQARRTREMMTAGVQKFLKENEAEIWPILRELYPYQAKGELPDAETAKRIAKRLLPLIDKAEKAIHEANDLWAQELAPEQRRLYEFDRKEMDATIAQMRTNFKKWEQGEVIKQEIFPRPVKKASEPPPPRMPDADELASQRPNPEMRATTKEALMSEFKRFVDRFIKDYQLDPTQTESAYSILREMEKRAEDHLSSIKSKMDEVVTRKQEAHRSAEWKKVGEFDKQIEELNAPVKALFDELKSRLDTIPTEGQRQAYEAAQKAAKEAAAKPKAEKKAPASKKPTKKPAGEKPAGAESMKEKTGSEGDKAGGAQEPKDSKEDSDKPKSGDDSSKPNRSPRSSR